MPTISAILTPNGLIPSPHSVNSLDGAAKFEGDGVYDVFRTYPDSKSLLLDAHFDRLLMFARLEGFTVELNKEAVRESIASLLAQSNYGIARVRIAISKITPDRLAITLEAFNQTSIELRRLRKDGVDVATYGISRVNPRAKTSLWVVKRAIVQSDLSKKYYDLSKKYYEIIITNPEGYLLEGFSSNFFAVKNGSLITSKDGILPGIMRGIVLEIAQNILPVKTMRVHKDELKQLDEAFLTSSSRGIIPIISIDGTKISDGRPGHFSKALSKSLEKWIISNIEKI
jgi:branched-chain amino acid aminotransferase